MTSKAERILLRQDDIRRVTMRIAHEILEQNRAASDLVLVGVQKRGVHLA